MNIDFYHKIFETSDAGMFISNVEGKLLHCNHAFLEIFGFISQEELEKYGTWRCFGSKDERIKYISLLKSKGSVKNYLINTVKNNGEPLTYKLNSSLINDLDSNLIIGSVMDITELNDVKKALLYSESNYRDLFEHSLEIIQSFDEKGNLVFCNKTWFEKFEYSAEEVKKINLFDIIHDEDKPHCKDLFVQVLSGKSFEEIEVRFVTKYGKTIYTVGNVIPMIKDGVLKATHAFFKDVTSKVLDKKRINEQEHLLQTIFESLPLCIYVKDKNGKYLLSNKQMTKTLGTEVLNKEDTQFFDSKTSKYLKEQDKLALETNEVVKFPLSIINSTSESHFLCGKKSVKNPSNPVEPYIFGYTLDITDSYLANKNFADKLQKSKAELQKLALIATKNPNMVIISNNHGEITWVNEEFTKVTGYELNEVIGKKPKDFLQTRETETIEKEKLSLALKEKKYVEATLTNINKNGQLYHNQIQIIPVFDDQNNHTDFIAVQKDITKEIEQKKLVENLNKFYRNTLKHSHSEIAVVNSDLKVEFYNRDIINESTVLDFVENLSLDEIILLNPKKNDWINELIVNINLLNESQSTITYEAKEKIQDGSEKNYLISVSRYQNENKKITYFISGVNITRIKLFERELVLKNTELQKINSELDNFVYSVSHDLRSPLLAIKGTVQLMINENPSLSNEIEYIPMILKSIDRLDDTIQEILTYSRNSRLEVSIEEIDVKQMIQEHFNDLHNFNDSKIELQYTSTCESLIRTDKMRVSAIIKNILSNAVKYSNQTNRTPIIKCNVSCINNFYIFEISDNGMGIEEEHLPHIFNMFYRATSKTIGTGLGLYIVKEALNKLNGTIRIESKVNVGTKVTIEIPRQSETTPQIKYLYN